MNALDSGRPNGGCIRSGEGGDGTGLCRPFILCVCMYGLCVRVCVGVRVCLCLSVFVCVYVCVLNV